MVLALSTYSVVLAIHIMAVVAAFGLPLAYPLLIPYVREHHPRAMPGLHDVQHRLNQRVTGTGTLVILLAGGYLAGKADVFGEVWVIVPIVILFVIGGVGGAVIVPASRKLHELATRDVAAAPADGPVDFGADYEAEYRRYLNAERLLGLLVLVAIFFMAAKPFA
jgi:hypothetical protein